MMPPGVGKKRLRASVPSSAPLSPRGTPASWSQSVSSSKVSTQSTWPQRSASSFFETQGPMNTTAAPGIRALMDLAWATIGESTLARYWSARG